MKISVARSAGFCFGVKRAIEIAHRTARSGHKVYMLGEIVHNETVIDSIRKAGIRKIEKLSAGRNKTLIIRAHGTARKTVEKAADLGYSIIDATCPMVKEIHKIAIQKEKEGYLVIIIGDKKHDEVRGIIGQLKNKPVVIEDHNCSFLKKTARIKKAAVVVQSTQNPEKVDKIVSKLGKVTDDLEFHDTICRPTKIKQNEAKILPVRNDVMIVIGSKTSANTKRLYEISKSLNPSTYWIRSEKEISPEWFAEAVSVGITAGASTPDSTIKKVIRKVSGIRKLKR